jgi:hypothetical protein
VTDAPNRTVELSFEYAHENDLSPKVTIHNASILIPSLSDQVVRYGLHKTAYNSPTMVGNLHGGRENFVAMIHSYGFRIEIVGPKPFDTDEVSA